jgi:1A family penicillin-binding protein
MQRIARFSLISLLTLLLVSMSIFGVLAFTVAGMEDIPDLDSPLTSIFFDRNNEVITTRFEQNRYEVPLDQLPEELIQAVIAVEDHRFYKHFGVDLQGLSRATLRNLQEWRLAEGGSTITQQLARSIFLTQEKTFSRKIQEALLAIQLERKFTKEEILEKYLNTIYFGHSAYGVEAAAKTYFGKSADELSLAEAAMLAGIPRGPAFYSPRINFDLAKKRQGVVLSRMVDQGFLSIEEKNKALAEELVIRQQDSTGHPQSSGAYFIDYLIQQELARIFPDDPQIVYRGGLKIYTTLDKTMQAAAENAVKNNLPVFSTDDANRRQPQVALVAMEPETGAVRALVGGRDFGETQFNRAIPPVTGSTRGRSPGSAFKPFVFAAALEAGYTPATIHVSEPVSYHITGQAEPYQPSEYGEKFYGSLRMRDAIARSSNIVAIKTHMDIGQDKTVVMAKKLGIESELLPVPSLPLGTSNVTPLEMTTAYATFANQGVRVKPLFINRITDSRGRVLYEKQPERALVLDSRIAFLITDMLKDVLRPGGTGSQLGTLVNRPAAAKTGTSDGHRDSYIVGYTPDLVASVWVGNDDNSSLEWGLTGSMREALKEGPPRDFNRPEGLVSVEICPETGLLHNPLCSLDPVQELFIAGTEPQEQCSWPDCTHCPPEWEWHWNSWYRGR